MGKRKIRRCAGICDCILPKFTSEVYCPACKSKRESRLARELLDRSIRN